MLHRLLPISEKQNTVIVFLSGLIKSPVSYKDEKWRNYEMKIKWISKWRALLNKIVTFLEEMGIFLEWHHKNLWTLTKNLIFTCPAITAFNTNGEALKALTFFFIDLDFWLLYALLWRKRTDKRLFTNSPFLRFFDRNPDCRPFVVKTHLFGTSQERKKCAVKKLTAFSKLQNAPKPKFFC